MTTGVPDAAPLAKPALSADRPAITVMIAEAKAASRAERFTEALQLWLEIEKRHGRTRDTQCGIGRAFRDVGDVDNAEAVLSEALKAVPDDAEMTAEHALVAEVRGDWTLASQRWNRHLETFPELRLFSGVAALANARAGFHARAETIMQEALSHQPPSIGLLIDHAIVAQYAETWSEAMVRWDRVLALAPDVAAYVELRGNAAWHESLQRSSATDHTVVASAPGKHNLADIITSFESIGDNCEFGLLQRKIGLEPVGLFRFSAVKPDKMVELLELRFSPLGDPAHLVMELDGDEYIVSDDRGYFWMHSFIRRGQMDETKYLKQQMARITLLKRKLVFHLEAGDKIYICKDSHERITDHMLYRLSHCLRRYGRNLLLGVRLADEHNPPGSVAKLSEHILVGHLASMSSSVATIDVTEWEVVLRKAFAYHHDAAASAA